MPKLTTVVTFHLAEVPRRPPRLERTMRVDLPVWVGPVLTGLGPSELERRSLSRGPRRRENMLRFRVLAGPPLASFLTEEGAGVLNEELGLDLEDECCRTFSLPLFFPATLRARLVATSRDCICESLLESNAADLYFWYHSVNEVRSYTSGGPRRSAFRAFISSFTNERF